MHGHLNVSLFTLGAVCGGWSAPRPGRFATGRGLVPNVWEAGWAPEPVWTSAENRTPHQDSIPGPSSPKRVAIPTELSRPPLLLFICKWKTAVKHQDSW